MMTANNAVSAAHPKHSPAPAASVLASLFARREASVFLAAVVMFVGLSLSTDTFLTQGNLLNLLKQISLLGIVAVGVTFVFIAGEIDLSVGALHGLLAIVFAILTIGNGMNPYAAALLVIACGMAAGTLSGFLATKLRLPSFIVTLGMLSIFKGVTLVVSGGQPVSGSFDPVFRDVFSGIYFDFVPAQAIWLCAAAVFGIYLLGYTSFGYHVFSTGGSKFAAQAVGISVDRIKMMAFALSGGLVAVASCILVAWFRGADTQAGSGLELSVIAAVIIGGTGLFGGTGSIVGTILGALIIGMISNGTVLLGIDSYYEPIAQGVVIILAVTIDIWSKARSTR
jgi:ribose transport system permease protein